MRRLTGQQKQRYSSGLIAIEVQESFDSKVHMSATHVKVGRASNVEKSRFLSPSSMDDMCRWRTSSLFWEMSSEVSFTTGLWICVAVIRCFLFLA